MPQTFVLMHGAWHGGWTWNAVAARLRAAGHEVFQPTAPGLSPGDDRRGIGLADAADHLVAYVNGLDLRDVTLVAHSWGGMVLSASVHRLEERLARAVYFNAFLPLSGQSLFDLFPPDYRTLFTGLAEASEDRTVALPLAVWRRAFMQDAEPAAQEIVHSLMLPQPFATFTDPVGEVDYDSLNVPTSYVISPDDHALPPGEYGWSRFPDRLADPRVIECVGSHESMFTAPERVSADLLRAAE